DEELTLSPEETAEAVVNQLGLSDADAERAQAMYVGLLAQLKQVDAQPAMPEMKALTAGGIGAQEARLRFEAAQTRQDAVSASVDRLNQKFWMKNPGGSSAVPTS